jgi:hypothetical protein
MHKGVKPRVLLVSPHLLEPRTPQLPIFSAHHNKLLLSLPILYSVVIIPIQVGTRLDRLAKTPLRNLLPRRLDLERSASSSNNNNNNPVVLVLSARIRNNRNHKLGMECLAGVVDLAQISHLLSVVLVEVSV